MTQKYAYEIVNGNAVIWRCFSRTGTAEIPKEIAGYPVTKIAPYAFSEHMDLSVLEGKLCTSLTEQQAVEEKLCMEIDKLSVVGGKLYTGMEELPALCGNRLESIVIPESVSQVGRYCFYNCEQLKHLSFSDTLKDWGSGAFTGCHHLDHLTIYFYQEGRSTLKDVLAELPEMMIVDYYKVREGQTEYARLVFPEFYEEGVENTPARLINLQIHGSGMRYRNCFRQRVLHFGEYDSCFVHAGFQDSFEIVAFLAEGRLRYPMELSKQAKRQYETFILENRDAFSRFIAEKQKMDALEWYMDLLGQLGVKESRPEFWGKGNQGEKESGQESYEKGNQDLTKDEQSRLLAQMIESCMASGWQEGLSYLMDRRHRLGEKKKRKTFDL